jgi:hypothetical protein
MRAKKACGSSYGNSSWSCAVYRHRWPWLSWCDEPVPARARPRRAVRKPASSITMARPSVRVATPCPMTRPLSAGTSRDERLPADTTVKSRGRFWSGEAEGGHLGECEGHRPVRDGRQVFEALLRLIQVRGAEHHPQAVSALVDPTAVKNSCVAHRPEPGGRGTTRLVPDWLVDGSLGNDQRGGCPSGDWIEGWGAAAGRVLRASRRKSWCPGAR